MIGMIIEKTLEKKIEEHYTNKSYMEMNAIIYLIYDFETEILYDELKNETVYATGDEIFAIEKGEDGMAILKGDIPTRLRNKWNTYNLKFKRKHE